VAAGSGPGSGYRSGPAEETPYSYSLLLSFVMPTYSFSSGGTGGSGGWDGSGRRRGRRRAGGPGTGRGALTGGFAVEVKGVVRGGPGG
jgi:hypothetical protein